MPCNPSALLFETGIAVKAHALLCGWNCIFEACHLSRLCQSHPASPKFLYLHTSLCFSPGSTPTWGILTRSCLPSPPVSSLPSPPVSSLPYSFSLGRRMCTSPSVIPSTQLGRSPKVQVTSYCLLRHKGFGRQARCSHYEALNQELFCLVLHVHCTPLSLQLF